MKKRTKITLRTKIYVTILGLLTLTGIIYAANPTTFSTFSSLTAVAATKTEMFVTGYFGNQDVYTLDCNGTPTAYASGLPPGEKYIKLAPAQSVNAGFTPRDLFLTYGQFIFKATPPGPFVSFVQIPCSGGEVDHTGITFDHVGTFGNDMILTCQGGDVFKVDNLPGGPHVTFLAHAANAGGEIEGPVVAPPTFGTFAGQILVADESNAEVIAIKNDGPPATVTHNIFNWPGFLEPSPEALAFIPQPQDLCTYCGFAFFQTSQQNPNGAPSEFAYAPGDFPAGIGGGLLVTDEQGQKIALVQFLGGNYFTSVFDLPPGSNILEGNSFVDCDVPTPTPTATATFTPTPTATFTPTATATFTPTPTATFTPTPTATFTPTPTATPTPTPTPTGTPTSCTALFVIGDLDAVVGNHVTFWSKQWSKDNHLSGVDRSPPSFKGFVTCTNNPPTCGDTWQGDPGNSGHPPDTIPADITVIVSSSITKSGSTESGNIVKLVTVHVDPCCYGQPVEAPGHEGRGIVTAVVCQSAQPGASQGGGSKTRHHASSKSTLKRLLHPFRK